jgi:hypothetical protein
LKHVRRERNLRPVTEDQIIFTDWADRQDLPLGWDVAPFGWCDDFASAWNAADAMLEGCAWECWADADEVAIGAENLHGMLTYVPEDVPALSTAWIGMPGFPPFPRERLFRSGVGHWIDRADCRKIVRGWPLVGWPVRHTDIRDVLDPRLVGFAHRRDPYRAGSVARKRRILEQWAEEQPENPIPRARLDRLAWVLEHDAAERPTPEPVPVSTAF